ncbi:unnamed protein product [Adineta steineri]|uniref:RING-type E3 ubiquitin transferase n=1 Tax=Adineta steineri TaxID=433720 RepID=A0A814IQ38_9BILA|nr:unnamed protein product [Adineta steineri]CAF3858595.1 unnamed protein product [Adineta steineri]
MSHLYNGDIDIYVQILFNDKSIQHITMINNLTTTTISNDSETLNNICQRCSSSIKQVEDDDVCPICFEQWTISGQHRVVSTYCGHLFGKICIEKWLRTTPNCPQCQSRAKRRDLRRIYCRTIQAVDTSERDNAIRERDFERKTRRKLEYEKAEQQLAYDTLREQFKHLQIENDRLLKLTQRMNNIEEMTNESAPIPSINIQLETVIKIPEGLCRVLAYVPSHQWLFISQPKNNALHRDYGIKKINLVNNIHTSEYISLHHTKPIRDIQLHGDFILSCSWDKTLRIYNYIENTSNLVCECTAQVWSCAWNLDEPNIIYAGLNNGQIQVFDRRQVHQNETLSLSSTSPILCLEYITKNSNFNSSGLLVGSNDKSGFYQYISNHEHHFYELPLNKNLFGLHYNSTTNHLLASFRPQSNPTRYELYKLIIKSDPSFNISLQLIQTFIGSSINLILSRSKILDKNFQIYIITSDNGSHGIELWNIRQSIDKPSFKLSTQCDIIDICLTQEYLCLLADNQIRLYKWT